MACLIGVALAAFFAAPAAAQSTGSLPAWVDDIENAVRIETWRAADGSNESEVRANLGELKAQFARIIANAVASDHLSKAVPVPLDWQDPEKLHWVFGWRVGSGPQKVTLIAHLDTVPPGSADWQPFAPRIELRTYNGEATDFLVGRGAIDDKGPAVVALHALTDVLPDLEKAPDALDRVTLEVLFDTSEETDMSMSYYFAVHPKELPALGVVFDASWCVRAEKGIERPVFSVPLTDSPQHGLWVSDLETPPGPANQIADWARARITGDSATALDAFAAQVKDWYRSYDFDDADYNSAPLEVTRDGHDIILTTLVAGAQHGSAPQENREEGANPLVSLGHFVAHLAATGVVGDNQNTRMARFMEWGWGTTVFGEQHPSLLYRYDPVFTQGNGTTYTLTRLTPDAASHSLQLAIDVRYAIGHQARGWNGTDGFIPGSSMFSEIFDTLVERYAAEPGGTTVTVNTSTSAGPDIRDSDNPYLSKVDEAYRAAMGEACPMRAIGGGTDAKGYPELVAAGPLFTSSFGPPVNYHGIEEGAPITDLVNSETILVDLLRAEAGLN